jgi:hypothetical protein
MVSKVGICETSFFLFAGKNKCPEKIRQNAALPVKELSADL